MYEILGIASLHLWFDSANTFSQLPGLWCIFATLFVAQFALFIGKGRDNGFGVSALEGDSVEASAWLEVSAQQSRGGWDREKKQCEYLFMFASIFQMDLRPVYEKWQGLTQQHVTDSVIVTIYYIILTSTSAL